LPQKRDDRTLKSYSSGVRNAALKILDEEGPSALLGGLGPTVVGYCVEGALKFGAYEALKPVMLSLLPSVDPAEPYLIAAVVAGALASVLLCPIEETRIRVGKSSQNGMIISEPC